MMNTKSSPLKLTEVIGSLKTAFRQHHHGYGLLTLGISLLLMSLLAGLEPPVKSHLFMVGDISDTDIVAHRSLIVEDTQATQSRRDQLERQQPTVFDFSVTEIANLHDKVLGFIQAFNNLDLEDPQQNDLKALFNRYHLPESPELIIQLSIPIVQDFIISKALPWVENNLREGVIGEARLSLPSQNGILIRNLETGEETLRPSAENIKDIQALLASLSHYLNVSDFSRQAKRSISALFFPLIMPTLTLNREASLSSAQAVANTVQPVYYNIQKGEIVVYQGERVSREKQLKLQSLYQKSAGLMHWRTMAGSLCVTTILSLGLFMAPSGKAGTPLRRNDLLFISLLVLAVGLGSKIAYLFLERLAEPQHIPIFSYFFPMAGFSGLCALIFAARRYCIVGIILAMLGAIMLHGGIALFLFFFLSAMLNTWLVIKAQSRQDVVLSFLPLAIGLFAICLGCAWLEGLRTPEMFLIILGLILCNALFSLIILFAFSPIIEMVFGYTTRFRLMELMNLEQPLLQELMVNIPGTYHHSLVVANMVEAGAKAAGANSLLCKVAALYHDIGKLAYPDYFIENQFSGPNRHDRLAPAMSALILGSHVKKGTELAAKHRVGNEIEDIIRQHHGTGLIKFFYNKAKEAGENPRIEEYCYPGPRPQTREAAIVMLADAVEASSRTLSDPTPARLRTHVDTIMKGIFSDGQLDESELTFKDLHILSESFSRILTGIFHQRIAYPDQVKKAQEAAEKLEKLEKQDKDKADKDKMEKSERTSKVYGTESMDVEKYHKKTEQDKKIEADKRPKSEIQQQQLKNS